MASDQPLAGAAEVPAVAALTSPILAIPFSFAGELTPGLLSLRFPLTGRWTFRAVSVVCVDDPTGSEVIVDVLYNGRSIYGSLAARPRVYAGRHEGTNVNPPAITEYEGRPGNPGLFACSIAQVGSGDPGGDLTLALYLTSA